MTNSYCQNCSHYYCQYTEKCLLGMPYVSMKDTCCPQKVHFVYSVGDTSVPTKDYKIYTGEGK